MMKGFCAFLLLLLVHFSLSQDRVPVCEQPMRIGPCRAMIPKFYFNSGTSSCEEFFYGGCDANDNNFETKEACMAVCQK